MREPRQRRQLCRPGQGTQPGYYFAIERRSCGTVPQLRRSVNICLFPAHGLHPCLQNYRCHAAPVVIFICRYAGIITIIACCCFIPICFHGQMKGYREHCFPLRIYSIFELYYLCGCLFESGHGLSDICIDECRVADDILSSVDVQIIALHIGVETNCCRQVTGVV